MQAIGKVDGPGKHYKPFIIRELMQATAALFAAFAAPVVASQSSGVTSPRQSGPLAHLTQQPAAPRA